MLGGHVKQANTCAVRGERPVSWQIWREASKQEKQGHLLFQPVHGLLLLAPRRGCLVREVMASGVHLHADNGKQTQSKDGTKNINDEYGSGGHGF